VSNSRNSADASHPSDSGATFASTFATERWQGPSFAASWISPPSPQRFADDPTAPSRSDDHA
jgi:hypothetical protein